MNGPSAKVYEQTYKQKFLQLICGSNWVEATHFYCIQSGLFILREWIEWTECIICNIHFEWKLLENLQSCNRFETSRKPMIHIIEIIFSITFNNYSNLSCNYIRGQLNDYNEKPETLTSLSGNLLIFWILFTKISQQFVFWRYVKCLLCWTVNMSVQRLLFWQKNRISAPPTILRHFWIVKF